LMTASGGSPATAARKRPLPRLGTQTASPIRHVVIIDQENHSFDNMLGFLCADVAAGRIVRPGYASQCDGTTTATLPDGSSYAMTQSADFGANVDHSVAGQRRAIHGGRVDGLARHDGCDGSSGSACRSVSGGPRGTGGVWWS